MDHPDTLTGELSLATMALYGPAPAAPSFRHPYAELWAKAATPRTEDSPPLCREASATPAVE